MEFRVFAVFFLVLLGSGGVIGFYFFVFRYFNVVILIIFNITERIDVVFVDRVDIR